MLRYVRSKATPKIKTAHRTPAHPASGKLPCCGGAMLLGLRHVARTYSFTRRVLLSARTASLVTSLSCCSTSGRIAIPSEAMRHAAGQKRDALLSQDQFRGFFRSHNVMAIGSNALCGGPGSSDSFS